SGLPTRYMGHDYGRHNVALAGDWLLQADALARGRRTKDEGRRTKDEGRRTKANYLRPSSKIKSSGTDAAWNAWATLRSTFGRQKGARPCLRDAGGRLKGHAQDGV